MKPSILLTLAGIAVLAACRQPSGHQPPQSIVSAFQKMHPQATILKWNDEPPIWEAKYKDGEEKGAVSFDKDAAVTETELVIAESMLPNQPVIPDYIGTHYPGEKIQSCEKVTRADGTVTYELQITGKEIVFDKDGKYLEEEPD